MNTQLIYCSKDTASVYNEEDGNFKCAVSQGIHVKQGDKVSIESIAINSRGVGADIIEIPTKIQNYLYKTNVVQLESWFYIHHNCDNTAPLPIGFITQNPEFSEVFATATDPGYGYMSGNVIFESLGPGNPPPLGVGIKTAAEEKIPSVFECSPSVNDCPSQVGMLCTIWPLLNNLQSKINGFLKDLTLKDIAS